MRTDCRRCSDRMTCLRCLHDAELSPGDPCEVRRVWAQAPEGPLTHWAKGYEFLAHEHGLYLGRVTCLVTPAAGLAKGIAIRFPLDRVRKPIP